MRECKNCCDVESCFLCKTCLPDWLPAISTHKKNFEVKKGQPVFIEDEPVNGIYFMYSGTIKIHKKWDREKELIIRFARPGDIIGHMGLGNEPKYPVSATALENAMVCYLDMAFFETTLNVNTNLTYKLMRLFANELQESQKTMRNLAHMSVRARIAQSFLSLKAQFGIREDGFLNIEISRQDIASYSASSYETLFKVATDFTRNNIIELTGRAIRIIDERRLVNIIETDNVH